MSTSSIQPADQPDRRPSEIFSSRNFPGWLAEQQVSLGFSTYQAGKLFLIGLKSPDRLSIFERTFDRCMGLYTDGQTLWLASAYQLWRLENVLRPGEQDEGYDRLFVPRVGYVTGDVDVHDVAVEGDGRIVFICTLFSCLATVSAVHNFATLWLPPFTSKLAAEDRCHLNGLALENGKARYVTACGQGDVVDSWRDQRADGGCVVDVQTDEVLLTGLSMPHSPRIYRDKLWLLDSGSGYFGFVDQDRGKFERVTFCPGFTRGLAFLGDYAVVGVSKCRRERTFSGLPLEENLAERKALAQCGLHVIDLRTGDVVHWVRMEGIIEELYDVLVLPEVVQPKLLGFKTDEIRRNVWIEEDGQPTRWQGVDRT